MQIGRLVALSLLVALAGKARASGPMLVIVQPAERFLDFGRTAYDAPGPTQRVLIRNDGDPVGHEEISVGAGFEIIGSGGGLGTGQVAFWDIACNPSFPRGTFVDYMDIDVCGSSCEDEWRDSIILECTPGLLDGEPSDVSVFANAYASTEQTVSFTNPGPDPLTITSLTTSSAMFSAAPAAGALPVTLAAGDHLDVVVTFTPTGSGEVISIVDVVAGTAIAGRTRVFGETISQITPAVPGIEMPLGARYSMPITVRNSFPSARTIAEVTCDLPGDVATGLAGVELAPGEIARGLVSFTADELGFRNTTLVLDFNTGQGDVGRIVNFVAPATYRVSTDDATPSDGLLDLGVREAGSAPVERTFTVTNLTDTDVPIVSCSGPSPPFELASECPTVLPASGSVQVAVRIAPTAPGLYAGAISLRLGDLHGINALLSAQVVASPPPPDAGVSDAGIPDPPDAGVPGAGDTPDAGASGPGHSGGCRAGGGESGLAIALLVLLRRRRRCDAVIKP